MRGLRRDQPADLGAEHTGRTRVNPGKERSVTFPTQISPIAAIGAGYGPDAATGRDAGDLDAVRRWLVSPCNRALVVDAKVAAPRGSWWLEEAFRGH